MVTVDELVKEIEGQSEVHSAWKGSKAQTQKGTVATKGKATYSTETTGPELENKVQGYALDLYTARGEQGNGDKKILASNLRTLLVEGQGGHYSDFEEALKIGDVDEANKLVKDAFTQKYGTAYASSTIAKATHLPVEERVKFGKAAIGKVGGGAADYVLAATNPGAVLGALSRERQAAYVFK